MQVAPLKTVGSWVSPLRVYKPTSGYQTECLTVQCENGDQYATTTLAAIEEPALVHEAKLRLVFEIRSVQAPLSGDNRRLANYKG